MSRFLWSALLNFFLLVVVGVMYLTVTDHMRDARRAVWNAERASVANTICLQVLRSCTGTLQQCNAIVHGNWPPIIIAKEQ